MIYLAWFILCFTAMQFLVACINLVSKPALNSKLPRYDGLVSVLIPVRNEAGTIHFLLDDLIHQDYRNIEILVFDDESDDESVHIIEDFIRRDSRIRLIHSKGLPEGWLGKMHACHTLSGQARGDYYLFLDADVRIGDGAIANAVSTMGHEGLGLLSVFPQQVMKTTGERISVPTMNYILLSLLPLMVVRKSFFSSFSAANGQFMFFKAPVYKQLLPHEKMKMNLVEDIAIARLFKENRIPVACLVGDDSIKCRMYNDYGGAVHGFSKNVTAFFGHSFILAFLFWLVTTAGFIVVYSQLALHVFFIYLVLVVLIRVFISVISHQNIFMNMLFIIPQQLTIGLFLYKAAVNSILKRYQWKGRTI